MKITERLNVLRELMKEKKIDAYLVPTDDFHGSEYVGDYFKCRKYITGFTGSAGTVVIMQDMAGLWTDGRYFIQAADQLRGSTIELFRSGEPGVPTVHQFLAEKLEKSMCLGFDGRTVSAKEAEELEVLVGALDPKLDSVETVLKLKEQIAKLKTVSVGQIIRQGFIHGYSKRSAISRQPARRARGLHRRSARA